MSTIIATTLSNGSVSVPTATVVNGSAKAWVNFNGTGTIAARDSFNVASLTDNGTGDYNVNLSNAMANAGYAILNAGPIPGNSGELGPNAGQYTTTTIMVQGRQQLSAGTVVDMSECHLSISGDLA